MGKNTDVIEIGTDFGKFYTRDDGDMTVDDHLALINGPIKTFQPLLDKELQKLLKVEE